MLTPYVVTTGDETAMTEQLHPIGVGEIAQIEAFKVVFIKDFVVTNQVQHLIIHQPSNPLFFGSDP